MKALLSGPFPAAVILVSSLLVASGCSSARLQAGSPSDATSPEQPSEGYKVVKVKDGDSVVVTPVGKEETLECHLYGVDAPELAKRGKPGQFFAEESRAALARLVESGPVNVLVTSRRTSGRAVCLIKSGSVDVNRSMIENGYAWASRKKLVKPFAELYVSAEERAKTERLGFWACEDPEAPWDYRERMKKLKQEEAVDDL